MLLAGELALGLLDGDELATAERLRRDDAGFAAQVAWWQEQFDGLYAEVPSVAPGDAVWPAIVARLPAATPVAANDAGPALWPWKLAAGGFGALAATLALMLVTRPDPAPVEAPPPVIVQAEPTPVPTETLVAQLNDGEGASMLAARLEASDGRLVVRATAIPDGAGEPELWVIPAGGAPRSLGLIAREGESRVRLGGDLASLVADGATLALTLEPADGAPHSAPSGDILGTARITRL